MRRFRWGANLVGLCVLLSSVVGTGQADAAEGHTFRGILVVDSDDDDDNGVADVSDAASTRLTPPALVHLPRLPRESIRAGQRAPDEAAPFRFLRPSGQSFTPGSPLTGPAIVLQGRTAGRGSIELVSGPQAVAVLELRALDAAGRVVDLARSHASLSRTLPEELEAEEPDLDALRWLVLGPPESLPDVAHVFSFGADGRVLDRGGPLRLRSVECPPATASGLGCRISAPVRASIDSVDREHPAAVARSVLAEVGGRLRLEIARGVGASIRVGGPRDAAGHTVGRYRATVRTHILRTAPRTPAVGADEEHARQILRDELATASALWGQCGIHFGPPGALSIRVVDAPPAHLFAVGCGEGQPASGGVIRVLVRRRTVEVTTRAGESPAVVASRLAEAIEAVGVKARVSVNAAVHRAATRTADVLVRDAAGKFVRLGTPSGGQASTDPSLPVCLGEVDLADGLQHFNDFDAGAGTVEERALIKGLEDDDPSTIELFVVPHFGGSGRIGESFIFGPGASLQSAVILDRAGLRSGARSFTLAHELGHVLLDMPGHPDDFGVDMPSSLMDADASDPTIFGPRRLSRADCERALRQSGPGAPLPLLQPWPLFTPAAAAASGAPTSGAATSGADRAGR